jgi:hypothetical protein
MHQTARPRFQEPLNAPLHLKPSRITAGCFGESGEQSAINHFGCQSHSGKTILILFFKPEPYKLCPSRHVCSSAAKEEIAMGWRASFACCTVREVNLCVRPWLGIAVVAAVMVLLTAEQTQSGYGRGFVRYQARPRHGLGVRPGHPSPSLT